MVTRRAFVRATIAAIAAGDAAALYAWRVEPHWLEIVRRPLPIHRLPERLAGCTLAHLSDLHVGRLVDDAYILHTFERVRALQPDLVVITGDLITWHPEILDQLQAVYDHLPAGRIATLGCFGNHDYGPGWAHPEIAAEIGRALARRGVRVLANEAVEVEGVTFVGLEDLWAGRFAPGLVMQGLDPARPAVVLSHNPDTVDLPGWGGFRGWVLGGHTHGGQCKPPFLPPPLLPVRNWRYTSGEFEVGAGRRLYISRGVGHLLRVRFNVRPEVTVFELGGSA